jgi:hypothetical protein
MWYLIYSLLGLTALGLYTKKGRNAIKFVQILIETVQTNKNIKIKPELEYINTSPVIKYGDTYINGCNTFNHYDIICFTSNIIDKVKHNYNPTKDICEKIPVTLLRSGSCIATIPFRPCDFNHNNLYIAIKRISHENYSVYKFEEREYINLNELFFKFENDIVNVDNQVSTLAECYD